MNFDYSNFDCCLNKNIECLGYNSGKVIRCLSCKKQMEETIKYKCPYCNHESEGLIFYTSSSSPLIIQSSSPSIIYSSSPPSFNYTDENTNIHMCQCISCKKQLRFDQFIVNKTTKIISN